MVVAYSGRSGGPWTGTGMVGDDHCEYSVYLQVYSLMYHHHLNRLLALSSQQHSIMSQCFLLAFYSYSRILLTPSHTLTAGQIDADELAAVVEKITEKQSTIRHMRFIIAALVSEWGLLMTSKHMHTHALKCPSPDVLHRDTLHSSCFCRHLTSHDARHTGGVPEKLQMQQA
jgi:hypothetical protein